MIFSQVRNCTSATFISPKDFEFDEKKKSGNKSTSGSASNVLKPAVEDRSLQATNDNIVSGTQGNGLNANTTDNLKATHVTQQTDRNSSENIQPTLGQI